MSNTLVHTVSTAILRIVSFFKASIEGLGVWSLQVLRDWFLFLFCLVVFLSILMMLVKKA